MPSVDVPAEKAARIIAPPKGYEQHLTRKQAAAVLGFGSEYKVRQLEKEGRLRSVRGRMGTAFYARADLLALRTELAKAAPIIDHDRTWSDAELLELLAHPASTGRPRTALDLVLETRIPIARAEAIVAFHAQHQQNAVVAVAPPPAPEPAPEESASPDPAPPAARTGERRSPGRRSRDELIRSLRHPDPAIRERAFKELQHAR